MDTTGTIGTPASMAARTYPVLPLKSITFCDSVGRSDGVVGDQQRPAGRDAAEVPDLGTEVALGDWPQEADDAFGQHRVPFGDPRPRQVRALTSGSDGTAISVTNLRENVMLL